MQEQNTPPKAGFQVSMNRVGLGDSVNQLCVSDGKE
jgi:hypothetical protein